MMAKVTASAGILGSLTIIAGSVLPWITGVENGTTVSIPGYKSDDGLYFLILACVLMSICAAAAFGGRLQSRLVPNVVLGGLFVVIFGLVDAGSVQNKIDQMALPDGCSLRLGNGMFVTIAGGVVCLAGSLAALVRKAPQSV